MGSISEIENWQRKFRESEEKLTQATQQNEKLVEQNRSLQGNLAAQRQALLDISQNKECVCSSDDTCRPQRIAMRALAGQGGELTKKIIDFLTEMSSQDNRGTAFPYIYTIADENERFEEDDRGEFFFDSNAGTIVEIKEVLHSEFFEGNIELEEDENIQEIIDDIGECYEDDRINDWLRNYNEGGIQRYTKEFDTYYEGTFFTESDAKEYLADTMNHHFGPNPRTYVDSMNKWDRTSKTTAFLTDLFNFFGVKIPPEMYYDKKKAEKETAEMEK